MTPTQEQAQAKAWEQERNMLVAHIVNGACRDLYSQQTRDWALALLNRKEQ